MSGGACSPRRNLHGGILHLWFNFGALRTLAPIVEAYAPRARRPLVYLAARLAGTVASLLLLPNQNSIGATGALIGALTIPRTGALDRRTPILDALGWLATVVVVAGAALAIARVFPLHRGLLRR